MGRIITVSNKLTPYYQKITMNNNVKNQSKIVYFNF